MKKLIYTLISFIFIISVCKTVYGNSLPPSVSETPQATITFTEKEILLHESGLEIKASLPQIKELVNPDLEDQLNALIQKIYDQKVTAAKKSRAKSIIFTPEYKYGNGITSILIQSTTTATSSKNEINSVNFNSSNQEITTINDVLGENGTALAEKVIGSLIKKDPDKYNPNFKGLDTEQAFFVEDNNIVFLFNEYQVGTSVGITEFSLQIDGAHNTTVLKSEYETKFDYGLKMIPLRHVCEELLYEVIWRPDSQSVDILKDGVSITSITIGQNGYPRERLLISTTHTLESAPELVNGITYVPISFFDVIMDMIYSVDDLNSNITFSIYDTSQN